MSDALPSAPTAFMPVRCAECRKTNILDSVVCQYCDAVMMMAYLESLGTGVIPKGQINPLLARNYRFGRAIDCDFIIPTNGVRDHHVNLFYKAPEGFFIRPDAAGAQVIVNNQEMPGAHLAHGAVITIGADQFVFRDQQTLSPKKMQEIRYPHSVDSLTLLNYFLNIVLSDSRQAVAQMAIQAVLRITQMERAVFFEVNIDETGEVMLKQRSAKVNRQGAYEECHEPIEVSQSLFFDSIYKRQTIVMSGINRASDRSESMVDLKLNAVMCLPIWEPGWEGEHCVALLYGDSAFQFAEMPKQCETMLNQLAQFVASLLIRYPAESHIWEDDAQETHTTRFEMVHPDHELE